MLKFDIQKFALSGSSGDVRWYSSGYIKTTWAVSQDAGANTSTLTARLYFKADSSVTLGGNACNMTIGGSTVARTIASQTIGTSYVQIASYTRTLNHNDNGTIANQGISGQLNGFTASTTAVIDRIARVSQVTATNSFIGLTSSINPNSLSADFTHTLRYDFGALNGTIATGVTGVYDWTLPASFYTQIPNALSGGCGIFCDTYYLGNLNGTSSVSIIAYVDQVASKPDISATIVDSNATTVALTGSNAIMVKGYSNADFVITSTAKNSATIVESSIGSGSKSAYTATGTLTGVDSGTFTVYNLDSRGLGNQATYTKTLVDYIPLTFNPTIYRPEPTTGEVELSYTGNYFNSTFGAVANTLLVKYRYKEQGGSYGSYTNLTPVKVGNTYSETISLGTGFDYTKIYEFEFYAEDKLITLQPTRIVTKGQAVFSFDENYVYNKDVRIPTILEVYPVGAVYISVVSTSPATLFGGTWSAFATGRTLVGIDTGDTDFDTVEETRGAKTHTLDTTQMPSHTHSIQYNSTQGFATGYCSTPNTAASTPFGGRSFISESTGGGLAHNNIQPSIVVYMWKRVS